MSTPPNPADRFGSRTHRPLEDERLNQVLARPDALLVESLRQDQRSRRWRQAAWALGFLLVAAAVGVAVFAPANGVAKEPIALTQEGWQLWQQGRLAEAEDKFVEATAADPQAESAWNGLGWARVNQGKLTEAVPAFEKCVELVPAHPAAHNGLGQVYVSLGKFELAEPHLLRAANSGASAAWFGLARLYLLQEKWDDCTHWAEKFLTADPQNAAAQEMLAAARSRAVPESLRQQLQPVTPEQQALQAAWQLHQTGQVAKARAAFEELLKQQPENADVLNGYGWVLLGAGEVATARARFEDCLKHEAKHGGALNGLAQCRQLAGDVDGAIELWLQMTSETTTANAGHASLAEVYFERGEFAAAARYYQVLADSDPSNEHYRQRLAEAQAAKPAE